MLAGIHEAKATLKGLLEDRGVLQEQLDFMHSKGEVEGSDEFRQLKEEIEIRSIQIQDLQEKVMRSDDESKLRSRFENCPNNLTKHAFKLFLEQSEELIKKSVEMKSRNDELQDSVAQASVVFLVVEYFLMLCFTAMFFLSVKSINGIFGEKV